VTPAQQSLVDAISAVLQRDARIEAAWLAGSLGRNAGDEFSDVDVVVLCHDGMATEIATPGLLDFARPVLVNTLFGGRIVNVITPDWQRFDLVFVEARDLARYNANDVKPLFNRTGEEPPRSEPPPCHGRISNRNWISRFEGQAPESSFSIVSRILNFCGLPVTVIGTESTKRM
jgi:predicted nucleotidyltransferase